MAAAYLAVLAVIFAAILYHMGRMLFGEADQKVEHGELGRGRLAVMAVLLVSVMVMGLYMPDALEDVLERMTSLFTGGP